VIKQFLADQAGLFFNTHSKNRKKIANLCFCIKVGVERWLLLVGRGGGGNMDTSFITKDTNERLPKAEHTFPENSQEIDMFATLYRDNSISVSALTDIGLLRSRNEDSFSVTDLTTGEVEFEADSMPHKLGERGALLVVADGMGGAAAGKLASEMTVAALREALIEDSSTVSLSARLAHATESANDQVYEFARQNPELTGMGTTLTAVLVQNNSAFIAQVGDSRAYLIRDENIHQLTKDQTLVQRLLDDGRITPEEALNYSRHVILQAIGPNPTVDYALGAIELQHNDFLLLCSDGLTGNVTSNDILDAVRNSPTLSDACDLLVDLANERGGDDNITVVLAKFYEAKLNSAYGSNSYKRVA
jgi:PPM family protein phosphatase